MLRLKTSYRILKTNVISRASFELKNGRETIKVKKALNFSKFDFFQMKK